MNKIAGNIGRQLSDRASAICKGSARCSAPARRLLDLSQAKWKGRQMGEAVSPSGIAKSGHVVAQANLRAPIGHYNLVRAQLSN
jgi:hypothetical protein